jgi:hypothetical protein
MAVAWDDERRATALLRLLGPFADRNASHSLLRTYAGSVAHFLGILAGCLRRYDEADAHFEAAARRNQAMGALPALCRTRFEHGRMLRRRGRKTDQKRAAALLQEAFASARALGLGGLEAEIRGLGAGG